MSVQITVNGTDHEVDLDPQTPLLWAIRDALGLKGTKFGCGVGSCGACTVEVDGMALRSCAIATGDVAGMAITTIEGMPQGGGLHPIQQAWIDEQVPQCGYCQPGMIMAVSAMLKETPEPSDAQISEQITNVCRCGTYPRIRKAIHRAAKAMSA
ncbi:(2Fe-2S)-binding protein [Croceicoccus gelatinilyticus]|uniref:(2Fe-2S)-binding protein n=1 Tax=Croceicoccus gelatinilyticus TaxID=2835536 RepID=UPI001BD080EF|nr:(2Fe-2S)-binding protein [Croceicoccus gelatinilyticus]MBS7669074.1 (2Fe-2S)-binding protein [Croceicoccus gelatinilyticus]